MVILPMICRPVEAIMTTFCLLLLSYADVAHDTDWGEWLISGRISNHELFTDGTCRVACFIEPMAVDDFNSISRRNLSS